MDIVVRSPHGDADVSIETHGPATTLSDLVTTVTGQAAARIVFVDGRTVDASTPLDDAALLIGAVVTTEPAQPPVAADTAIDLVQIAGHGSGRSTRLAPGRYRIGPGRRTNAAELDIAPVEQAAFDVVIESTPSSSATIVVPGQSEIRLDGAPIASPTPWDRGTLTVGTRAFQLDAPAVTAPARTLPAPDRDGTVEFSRPPRRRDAPARRPVVDAIRDAASAAPWLWERRPDDRDAYVLPFGWIEASASSADIDIAAQRSIAIAGTERFRSALARTLVVEAVTLHGPADLELAVLTSHDRVAEWDWAKWISHLRPDRSPTILSSHDQITAWALASPEVSGRANPLAMVVVDDPSLWNRRDSPLRSIVSNPPGRVRLIALCDDPSHAPAICTAVIAEVAGGRATLRSFTDGDDVDDVLPALTEPDVAGRVARSLAPLTDVELPVRDTPATIDRPGAAELAGVVDDLGILARWAAAPTATVTIGHRDQDRVDLAVSDEVTVVVGPSMGDAFDVAATFVLGQCVDRSPDTLWIVPLMPDDDARSELLWQLPHATDRHPRDRPVEPRRLLDRVRAVLHDANGPDRILLVVESARSSSATVDDRLIPELINATRSTPGLALLVISDGVDAIPTGADTLIRVERPDASSSWQRSATILVDGDAATASAAFAPLQPAPLPAGSLGLRAFVVGRALTALERRVEQHHSSRAFTPDPTFAPLIHSLRVAVSRRGEWRPTRPHGGRTVVPAPLPTSIDLEELFAASPGDGVPLGLVDDPSTANVRPRWWEPGDGSLLLFGSRRSGIEQVLSTITLGVIDRFAPDDVRLVVIEPSSARRRALGGIDRGVSIVALDRADEVGAALDDIEIELAARDSTDRPRAVVLIGDLAQLRRQFADQPLATRIDDVLTAAGSPDSPVDVVAYAGDLLGAGPFAATAGHRLVGTSDNRVELAALGVDEPSELGIAGRCRSFPDGDLVQLAMSQATTEMLLGRRSTGGNA